jgi:putative hydrolase of the HAD superfamily
MDAPTILFFDLDGTLVVNPFRTAVWPRVTDFLAPQAALTNEQLLDLFLKEFLTRIEQNSNGETGMTVDWDDIVKQVMAQVGVRCELSICELIVEHAHAPYIRVLDEGDSVLRALLKAGNRKLVVSTMGMSKYQLPVLEGLGLLQCFSEVLTPDLTGFLKTDRRFYRSYTSTYPVQNLISIGDHFHDDIMFPKSLGFTSILRAPFAELNAYDPLERCRHLRAFSDRIPGLPEHPEILPDAVVTSLQELPEVVQHFERVRASIA